MKLPPTLDVMQASTLLGVDPQTAYNSVKAGSFPIPVIRVGRRIRVATRPLLAALGMSENDAAGLLGVPVMASVMADGAPSNGSGALSRDNTAPDELGPLECRSGAELRGGAGDLEEIPR